jgi:hypothetical protein
MSTIVQTLSVDVPANLQGWTNTNLILRTGETLHFNVRNYVYNDVADGQISFAEGSYPAPDDVNTSKTEDLGSVIGYGAWGGLATQFVVLDTAPQGLSALILPQGEVPPTPAPGSVGSAEGAIRVTRNLVLPYSLASGVVWLIFNDVFNKYRNNSGAFHVTISRTTDEALEVDIGLPSPKRYVPPGILAMKRSSKQCFAWCLAVKPRRGYWEGYTDWDLTLALPEYEDVLGNVIPAMGYKPAGASLSNLSTQLKLGTTAVDVTVMAPIEAAYDKFDFLREIFLDRKKIRNHYYDDAEWILFEVMPLGDTSECLYWQAGRCGNTQLNDLSATIELASYEEIANRKVGDVLHIICQVGTRPGENFGNGRCRNQVMQDGPLRADWTVEATIEEVLDWNSLRLSYGALARSGAALHAEFHERLANGDLEFDQDAEIAGENAGVEVGIKSGSQNEDDSVTIVTRISLPYLPQVGDVVNLVAGCRRNKTDCILYNNLSNMRSQDLPSSDDLLRRTRV